MKIELAEDNGFLNNGVPSLVVLVVTTDDGKQRRIPYQADRTIQQLYEDVRKMNAVNVDLSVSLWDGPERRIEKSVISNDIDREDIVKCLRTVKDIDGRVLLEKDKEYKVQEIVKRNGKLVGYELIDKSEKGLRYPCLYDDVVLIKKFIPNSPRMANEEVKKIMAGKSEEELANVG